MTEKKSMIFNHEWIELFEDFTEEEVGQLTLAIMKYDKTGENTTFSDRAMKSVFRTMKQYVDINKDKYEKKCKKMSENGKKGGRPSKENEEEKKQKSKSFFQKAKKADTDSDTDTDTDTVSLSCERALPKEERACVLDFFSANHFKRDPNEFIDYNVAQGNAEMFKDAARWQAMARLFERKGKPPNDFDLNAWAEG